jgi:caspase domain-containing protein
MISPYKIASQAFFLVAGLVACSKAASEPQADRGIKPLHQLEASSLPSFDRAQSAGFFVGVNSFSLGLCDACRVSEKKIIDLSYAVDDAIDLAYRFSIQLGLLPASEVRLLLSGQPYKEISRLRLDELGRAGATVIWQANKATVLSCLTHLLRQHAGKGGLLVVSISSHGTLDRGEHYILGSDAIHDFLPDTSLRTATLFELTASAPSSRRLILIDACRDKLIEDGRGLGNDPQTAIPAQLVSAIGKTEGEAILLAARTGGWAFEDPEKWNGVFTRALLDSLKCEPCSDRDGMITVSTLADEVDRRVSQWTALHRKDIPPDRRGITQRIEGSIAALPLLLCPQVKVPDACRRSTLPAIELLDKNGTFQRFAIENDRITIPSTELEGVDELVGRPVFPDVHSYDCPWRWEELRALDEWERLGSRPGGVFSIDKPSSGRAVSLRLMLCGTEPKEVDLIVQ